MVSLYSHSLLQILPYPVPIPHTPFLPSTPNSYSPFPTPIPNFPARRLFVYALYLAIINPSYGNSKFATQTLFGRYFSTKGGWKGLTGTFRWFFFLLQAGSEVILSQGKNNPILPCYQRNLDAFFPLPYKATRNMGGRAPYGGSVSHNDR